MKNLRPFHTTNEALYTMEFSDLIPRFLSAFDMVVHSHTKTDICLYTQQADPAALIRSYLQNPSEYQRRSHKSDSGFLVVGKEDETTGAQDPTTYFNHDSKTVRHKFYNKTNEIVDKGHKPYIPLWLAAAGLKGDGPIYSAEQSIMARAWNNYKPYALTADGEKTSRYRASLGGERAIMGCEKTKTILDISKLQNRAYLASIFAENFNIDIRETDKSRINNCTKVPLIDFTVFGAHDINKAVSNIFTCSSLVREKRMIKDCLEEFKQTSCPTNLTMVANLAHRHGLNDYLTEWIRKTKVRRTVEAQGLDFLLENYKILKQLNIAV